MSEIRPKIPFLHAIAGDHDQNSGDLIPVESQLFGRIQKSARIPGRGCLLALLWHWQTVDDLLRAL